MLFVKSVIWSCVYSQGLVKKRKLYHFCGLYQVSQFNLDSCSSVVILAHCSSRALHCQTFPLALGFQGVDESFRTMDRDSHKCTVCDWLSVVWAALFLLSPPLLATTAIASSSAEVSDSASRDDRLHWKRKTLRFKSRKRVRSRNGAP